MIRILLFITALSSALTFEKTKNSRFLLLKLARNLRSRNLNGYSKNGIPLNKNSLTAMKKSKGISKDTAYPKVKGFRMFGGNEEWPDIIGDQNHEKKAVQPRASNRRNKNKNFRNPGESGFRTEPKKDKNGITNYHGRRNKNKISSTLKSTM